MNEKIKNPDEETELTPEQEMEEYLKYWLAQYEKPETPSEGLDHEPHVIFFELMMREYEEERSLEKLHAITHLPEKDSEEHRLREEGKVTLKRITSLLKFLREATNIPREKSGELWDRYRKLSRAVGMVTSDNSIDHTR